MEWIWFNNYRLTVRLINLKLKRFKRHVEWMLMAIYILEINYSRLGKFGFMSETRVSLYIIGDT